MWGRSSSNDVIFRNCSVSSPQTGAARAVTHGGLQHQITVSLKSLLMNLCIIGFKCLFVYVFFNYSWRSTVYLVPACCTVVRRSYRLRRDPPEESRTHLAPTAVSAIDCVPGATLHVPCLFRHCRFLLRPFAFSPSPQPPSHLATLGSFSVSESVWCSVLGGISEFTFKIWKKVYSIKNVTRNHKVTLKSENVGNWL